jgi:hypothetical protein
LREIFEKVAEMLGFLGIFAPWGAEKAAKPGIFL